MLKRIVAIGLLVCSLSLQGCVAAGSGLKSFVDSIDGYQFLYPNGWVQVAISGGPDVVFHDIIQQTENVSVVINPIAKDETLRDLGTPSDVGYRLSKSAIAPPNSGRTAELVNAQERTVGDKTYYLLEYAVKAGDQLRHNLASVAVSRGNLYTINVSTPEARWDKMKELMAQVIQSFSVY